jgi:glutamate-1-semialdehyde aminotransferase
MLERGVYLAPSQLEASFTSAAHGAPQIAAFERAAAGAMANMK